MKMIESAESPQRKLCAVIVSEHRVSVARLVGALLRNVPSCSGFDVDDVVQTTFLRLYQTVLAGRLDSSKSVASYVRTIARNVARDLIRSRVSNVERLRTIAWSFPGDVFNADADLSLERVDQCIETLPVSLRALYELRFEQGLSQEVTARRLACSRQNVRTLEAHLLGRVNEVLGAAYPVAPIRIGTEGAQVRT